MPNKKLKMGFWSYAGLLGTLVVLGIIFYFIKYPYAQVIAVSLAALIVLIPWGLRDPEMILGLIGFFLPFERIPSINLGGFNLRINYVLIVLLLVLYIISKAGRKELKIPRDPIFYLILLFFVTLTFSFGQAVNRSRAIQTLLSMALMVLTYFTVTLAAQDKKTLLRAVRAILLGAAVAVVFGFYQFVGDMVGLPNSVTLLKEGYDKSTFGFARIQAGSQEPLYFANYIFIPLSILLVFQIRGIVGKIASKWFSTLLSVGLMICFVLAISRGAYLAGAIVAVIFAILQAKRVLRFKILFPLICGIAIILLGAYLALVKSEPRALDEFISHMLVEDRDVGESVVGRLTTAEQAREVFASYPIFGAGMGNFGPVMLGDPADKPDTGWPVANNEYLEVLAENGVVGFIFFVLMLAAVFYRAVLSYFRTKDEFLRSLILALTLALTAIMIQYATFSTLYVFHVWFLLGLVGAIANIAIGSRESHSNRVANFHSNRHFNSRANSRH